MKSRYKFCESNRAYFITSTIVEWIPVFLNDKYCKILINSFNFCRQNKDLKLFAYVVMDNHFHAIVSSDDLSNIVSSLKKHTAHEIINNLKSDNKTWLLNQLSFYKKKYKVKSDYQVWQEGVHPELIISNPMMEQKINYIHYNPVKRGLVLEPEHWKYSSARNYFSNDNSIIELDSIDN